MAKRIHSIIIICLIIISNSGVNVWAHLCDVGGCSHFSITKQIFCPCLFDNCHRCSDNTSHNHFPPFHNDDILLQDNCKTTVLTFKLYVDSEVQKKCSCHICQSKSNNLTTFLSLSEIFEIKQLIFFVDDFSITEGVALYSNRYRESLIKFIHLSSNPDSPLII